MDGRWIGETYIRRVSVSVDLTEAEFDDLLAWRLDARPCGLMTEAAAEGLGIAYVSERTARPYLGRGQFVTVLDEWCPRIPGPSLYRPSHRHVPLGLKAFIAVLRAVA